MNRLHNRDNDTAYTSIREYSTTPLSGRVKKGRITIETEKREKKLLDRLHIRNNDTAYCLHWCGTYTHTHTRTRTHTHTRIHTHTRTHRCTEQMARHFICTAQTSCGWRGMRIRVLRRWLSSVGWNEGVAARCGWSDTACPSVVWLAAGLRMSL